MVSLEIWLDKLPCDKVEYFNKQRMSIELFGKLLGIGYSTVLLDLKKHGYVYSRNERTFYMPERKKHLRGLF